MSKDIIITDENFLDAAEEIASYGTKLEESVRTYIEIMSYITQEAVKDEKIRGNLCALIEQVRGMEEMVRNETSCVRDKLKVFISDIDEADQFLY